MKYIISLIVLLITFTSCDYLDIVPDDSPDLSDAFKNEDVAEGFVFSCYSYIPNYMNFRKNFSWMTTPEAVGSAHWNTIWFDFMKLQEGEFNATTPVADVWQNSYEGIRQCYTFLDNVDEVPAVRISEEELNEKKVLWKGEVRFLIAYYHYLLIQNYGPIVIVDDLIDFGATGEGFYKPRSSYDESVAAVAAMFDEAMKYLPATVNSANAGRATKVVAQALKARMYLYAASPLFNGNSMYADFVNKDGKQLISQTYDENKWQVALIELEKAIEEAEKAGNELYIYQDGEEHTEFEQAVLNMRNIVTDRFNSELIWGYTGWKESWAHSNSIQTHIIVKGISPNARPYGALGTSMIATNLFNTQNGLPIDEDPSFDYENRFKIEDGDSIPVLHRYREPRFYGYVGYDRGKYWINGSSITLKMKFQEQNGTRDPGSDQIYSSYAIQKLVHPETFVGSTSNSLEAYPFPIIRLGELYLSYAEAYAEINGELEGDALTYFNRIRSRAGIPSLQASYGTMPTGDKLIEIIRHERTVELMFEGHMHYDYRRWLIAEEEFGGYETGMIGLNAYGRTNDEYYREELLSAKKYVFVAPKMYLSPIKQEYINVNQNLVQNPGW